MNGTMMNPMMYGMMGYGGQQMSPQQMYAMSLMGGGSSQPTSSPYGAMSNAFSPILGAAMARWGVPGFQSGWGNQQNPGGNMPLGGGGAAGGQYGF